MFMVIIIISLFTISIFLCLLMSIILVNKIYIILRKILEEEKNRFELIGKIKKEKNRLINKNFELLEKLNYMENPEHSRIQEHIDIKDLSDEYVNSITNSFEIVSYLVMETRNIRQIYGNKRLPEELEDLLKKTYLNIRDIL